MREYRKQVEQPILYLTLTPNETIDGRMVTAMESPMALASGLETKIAMLLKVVEDEPMPLPQILRTPLVPSIVEAYLMRLIQVLPLLDLEPRLEQGWDLTDPMGLVGLHEETVDLALMLVRLAIIQRAALGGDVALENIRQLWWEPKPEQSKDRKTLASVLGYETTFRRNLLTYAVRKAVGGNYLGYDLAWRNSRRYS